MENLDALITTLQVKIEKLVHLHSKQEEENRNLVKDKYELMQVIEKQNDKIRQLEEINKVAKLAETEMVGNQKTSEIKAKINALVVEIDKCIALLNK